MVMIMKLSENRNSRSIYGNIVKTFIKLSFCNDTTSERMIS